jgi:hypothetical protein
MLIGSVSPLVDSQSIVNFDDLPTQPDSQLKSVVNNLSKSRKSYYLTEPLSAL